MFEIHQHTYGNGVRFLRVVAPLHTATAHVVVGVGSRHEDGKVAGIAHLSEHVRFRGTARYKTSTAVTSAFETIGGDHNAMTGTETMSFYASCLPNEIYSASHILADLVAEPLFEKTELDQERGVVLQEITTRRSALEEAVTTTIFGTHAIGRPVAGTRATVAKIQVPHLEEHHRTHFVGERIVVVVTAPREVNTQALIDSFAALGELPAKDAPQIDLFEGYSAPNKVRHVTGDVQTPTVTLVYPIHGHRAADAWHITPLVSVLQRTSGPLFRRMRSELGLLYHVDVSAHQVAEAGGLVVSFSASDTALVKATSEILALLHTLGDVRTMGTEAFEATRKASLTWAARICDDPEELAAFYASEALWESNLTPSQWAEKMRTITCDAVCAHAQSVFRPEAVRMITSGSMPVRTRNRLKDIIEALETAKP